VQIVILGRLTKSRSFHKKCDIVFPKMESKMLVQSCKTGRGLVPPYHLLKYTLKPSCNHHEIAKVVYDRQKTIAAFYIDTVNVEVEHLL
jgi:hypothetical protein